MRRVVITGIGAVSPLGNTFSESWKNAKAGISGITHLTRFDASCIPWKMAGELKGFDAGLYLSIKEIKRLDSFVHYAVAASIMAAEDAGLIQKMENRKQNSELRIKGKYPDSIPDIKHRELPELLTPHSEHLSKAGVIIGSSRGGIATLEKEISKFNISQLTVHSSRISHNLMPSTTISMAASYAAQILGINGHCLGISNACSSGTNAIGEAYRLIKSGYKGPVFAGGGEAPICLTCFLGYGTSGALSKINSSASSRPFNANRDGFVLSEGACILLLEEYESAMTRKAEIYGEIIGYGNNTDSYHQIRPASTGEAAAIRLAMQEADIHPADISYISAHGTSTIFGDKAESDAIRIVFGDLTDKIPVSALKSITGHMLAASGALETAFTLMSLREGILIPTANLNNQDSACRINVIKETKKADVNIAITNSFGFGGVNAVLVLRKLT